MSMLSNDMSISVALLNKLDWKNVDEMLRIVIRDNVKTDQVIQISEDMQNPVALYLRGFVFMINKQPLQALTVFNQLETRDIPPDFLYPVYRLQRQIRPGSVNRYLHALKRAIGSGKVSSLIAARVEAQEGDLYSALLNYLKTDPVKWVSYDVKCIKRIGQHSGLSSEVLRMISGALKTGRIAKEVEKPLRRLLTLENDSEEIAEFKRNLGNELSLASPTGKIAASSVRHMLETRSIFLKRDYQTILTKYRDSNPVMLPNESVLILFLSSVQLKNQLEMDRWGQEIKRRYQNQEVIDWVAKLITSVK